MHDNLSISVAKKKVEKSIINELYKKDVIDFIQYNSIIKRLEEDIVNLEKKLGTKEDMANIIVKISI